LNQFISGFACRKIWGKFPIVDASVTTRRSETALLRISLSGRGIRLEPNKPNPRFQASSGCYPLSAPLASIEQSVLSSEQRHAERRLGQPGESPEGVAKIDRARMGLSYLQPEKRRSVGSRGYTSWLHTGQRAAVRSLCLKGQGKLPLSPPGQVVQNRIVLT
jgi:hypothetical protein